MFSGSEAINTVLEEFDSWLSESMTVYLLGGIGGRCWDDGEHLRSAWNYW